MVNYTCNRCGYDTTIRTHMHNHYKRKKKCTNLLNGYSIDECILEIEGLKNIRFKKCVQMRSDAFGPTHSSKKTYKNALGCVGNALECVGNIVNEDKSHLCNNCGKKFKHKRFSSRKI